MITLTSELLAEVRQRATKAPGGPHGLAFSHDGVPTPALVLALLNRIEALEADLAARKEETDERDHVAMERSERAEP
jgi:hypothetical protein